MSSCEGDRIRGSSLAFGSILPPTGIMTLRFQPASTHVLRRSNFLGVLIAERGGRRTGAGLALIFRRRACSTIMLAQSATFTRLIHKRSNANAKALLVAGPGFVALGALA